MRSTHIFRSRNSSGFSRRGTFFRPAGGQGAFFTPSTDIQTKLTIGAPGDVYEREADAVAEQVVSGQKPASPVMGAGPLQLKCADCAKEEKLQRVAAPEEEEPVQMEAAPEEEEPMQMEAAPEEEEPVQMEAAPEEEEVQMEAAPEEEEMQMEAAPEEEEVQTKSESGATTAAPDFAARLGSQRGRGNELSPQVRSHMEQSIGADFSGVRIHTDSEAVQMNREVNAHAFTNGQDIYFNSGRYNPDTTQGQRLLAHELTHVVQQGRAGEKKVQRQDYTGAPVAAPGPEPALPATVHLTPREIREAIMYNRSRYTAADISLIQQRVGAADTGIMDEATVNQIAIYQGQHQLNPDGMVGPITFDQIASEFTGTDPSQNCLTLFHINGPSLPLNLQVAGPGLANIFSRFEVEARFSPHCNCNEFEYRQFIRGNVTLTRGGVTQNLNHLFLIPGGGLPGASWVQDGNTQDPGNGRYGHRLSGHHRSNNEYRDSQGNVDMANGCSFHAFDVPGLFNMPEQSGDDYTFDIRFYGEIRRNGVMQQQKFWSVRDSVTIP